MQPKIIKNEADYKSALAHIESLMDSLPGTPQEEELELFATLVENYEDDHFPISMPNPVEAIKFRMEQQGLTRKDLAPYIGSQSKVSEVLNGKRPLSITMIRALEKGLGIPAAVLLQVPGENPEQTDDEDHLQSTSLPEEEFFGEITLQVSESLQQQLIRSASRAGLSLNAYINTAWESFINTTSEQKTHRRAYPGLSTAALQLMRTNGLEAEANRSDELLFGQWLKQQVDEIEKKYAASEFEESSHVIENMLTCLADNISESPIIEGLVRVLQFQKSLLPSYLTNMEILHTTPEKLNSQIDMMISQVNVPNQKFNAEFGMNYVEATSGPESNLADFQFQKALEKNKMVSGK